MDPDDAVDEARQNFEKLSTQTELFIASAWIFMIAACPVILVQQNRSKITKIHYVEFAILILWLAGGIYLFTNVILFVSIHFEGERSLTIVQAVYFLSQIITTVGYGDIGPARARGRLAVAIYIIASLLVVANIVMEVTSLINEKISAKLNESSILKISEDNDDDKEEAKASMMRQAYVEGAPTRQDWQEVSGVGKFDYKGVASSCTFYILVAGVGAAFFHLHPAEGKSLFNAIYMSIVTLSTVGFGQFTAESAVGQAFSAFWMLMGVGALGAFVGGCIELSMRMKQAELFNKMRSQEELNHRLERVKVDKQDRINAHDFLKFALVQAGHCSEDQIQDIVHMYRRLRPDKEEKVPYSKLKKVMLNEGAQKIHRKKSMQTIDV